MVFGSQGAVGLMEEAALGVMCDQGGVILTLALQVS